MPLGIPAVSPRAPSSSQRRSARSGRRAPALIALAFAIAATGAFTQTAPAQAASLVAGADARDNIRPIVAVQVPTVELGKLLVRWTETRPSADALRRTLHIETAPATATGCGSFRLAGGVVLRAGAYERGAVFIGSAPSNGCVRASLALTYRSGDTSLSSSAPLRVVPLPAKPAKPAAKPWTGKFNLFRKNAFVTQKTFKWCVGASVQFMVNIVKKRTDRSTATQRKIMTYAQRWDNGPYGEEGGTDVTGWIRALRHFGAGKYRAISAKSAAGALRVAATAMGQTGRPAGILVMEGRHAWVLHGFESRTDPKRDRRAKVTAVRVSGPLYPKQQTAGYDPRPNTRMTVRKLERYFQPTVIGDTPGRYVVIVPTH